jgi:hypothetical protein
MNRNNGGEMAIKLDINSLEDIKCECGCGFFEQIFAMKRVPALQSPTGREEILPIPFMVCKQCGKPVKGKGEEVSKVI